MDMEIGSCKIAPTIADSTNETKNADTTNATIKVPDNVYAEVCAILAALPTLADAVGLKFYYQPPDKDQPKKKRIGRATRSGGARRRHGRPPDRTSVV